MTMPLSLLAWAGFLGALHALSTGVANTMALGMDYAAGPRDQPKPLGVKGERNIRAFHNFLQTFPMFAVGVLVSAFANKDHGLATFGAQLYFWTRLIYVPLYISGSKYRTYVWMLSFLGILLIYLHLA